MLISISLNRLARNKYAQNEALTPHFELDICGNDYLTRLQKLTLWILSLLGIGSYLVRGCSYHCLYTELWNAGLFQNWDEVKWRLNSGANPSAYSELQNDRTALYWPVISSKVDVVSLFISKGVDLNIIDSHGATAYDWAEMVCKTDPHDPEAKKVFEMIKAAGGKDGEGAWQDQHKEH